MGIQGWDNIPPRTTRGEVFAKTLMGLLIGGILAFLFFIIVSLAGDTLTTMLQTAQIEGLGGNPLLPMLMLIIAFITTFIGTASVAGLYNVFYSKDYYDLGSMLRSVMIVNVILFLFFAPIYLLFASNLDSLFFVIAFHIVFSVFLCMCQMEILVNPHYSGSSLIGSTIGVVGAMFWYAAITKTTGGSIGADTVYLYVLFPPIFAYTSIPFAQGIWKMIYYKMYEGGSDPYYVPSPSEIQQLTSDNEQQQTDDVLVDDFM